ncbi:MAG: class I SAM-dependent methyltransferase, partial [Bacteroidota bacterium]
MADQIDQYGAETLDAISVASRFNRWMYKTIKPFSKNDIIEIGSGIGNISQFFVTDGSNIRLSDINEAYLSFLRDKYGKQANVLEILNIDISHSDFTVRYTSLLEKSDTVFSLNVLEHVEDEKLALENYLSLIKPGGNIIIL